MSDESIARLYAVLEQLSQDLRDIKRRVREIKRACMVYTKFHSELAGKPVELNFPAQQPPELPLTLKPKRQVPQWRHFPTQDAIITAIAGAFSKRGGDLVKLSVRQISKITNIPIYLLQPTLKLLVRERTLLTEGKTIRMKYFLAEPLPEPGKELDALRGNGLGEDGDD